MAVERMESIESVTSTVSREEEAAVTSSDAAVAGLVTYPIAPGVALNVRSGPGTGYRIVRVLPEGSRVSIFCQSPGESVSGPYGTTSIWDNISNGEYVSDAYVRTGSDGYIAPRCS
ncbi:SH3 domain-containing protein [Streptomyces sp. NPDC005195]|uniref:SH3 domain-containing protein n=1 Tax=Streptomyces sp. NPDC005195 TaxID=3154561 RepID=UPI0033ADF5C6